MMSQWKHSTSQETGVVVNRQLASPLQQCSSTFLALDSDFFEGKPDSCGSPGCLLSWYQEISSKSLNQVRCSSRSFIFLTTKIRHALNTTSLKCYLLSTDAIDRWEKNHVYVWRFKGASCKRASLKSTRFLQKQSSDTFIRVVYIRISLWTQDRQTLLIFRWTQYVQWTSISVYSERIHNR